MHWLHNTVHIKPDPCPLNSNSDRREEKRTTILVLLVPTASVVSKNVSVKPQPVIVPVISLADVYQNCTGQKLVSNDIPYQLASISQFLVGWMCGLYGLSRSSPSRLHFPAK